MLSVLFIIVFLVYPPLANPKNLSTKQPECNAQQKGTESLFDVFLCCCMCTVCYVSLKKKKKNLPSLVPIKIKINKSSRHVTSNNALPPPTSI